ncbi:hypothetical protein J6590_015827 [Homalodisca vitripennis]|nr:hypothetical protein J6590_015827 [Homalodisca vitripennis]
MGGGSASESINTSTVASASTRHRAATHVRLFGRLQRNRQECRSEGRFRVSCPPFPPRCQSSSACYPTSVGRRQEATGDLRRPGLLGLPAGF